MAALGLSIQKLFSSRKLMNQIKGSALFIFGLSGPMLFVFLNFFLLWIFETKNIMNSLNSSNEYLNSFLMATFVLSFFIFPIIRWISNGEYENKRKITATDFTKLVILTLLTFLGITHLTSFLFSFQFHSMLTFILLWFFLIQIFLERLSKKRFLYFGYLVYFLLFGLTLYIPNYNFLIFDHLFLLTYFIILVFIQNKGQRNALDIKSLFLENKELMLIGPSITLGFIIFAWKAQGELIFILLITYISLMWFNLKADPILSLGHLKIQQSLHSDGSYNEIIFKIKETLNCYKKELLYISSIQAIFLGLIFIMFGLPSFQIILLAVFHIAIYFILMFLINFNFLKESLIISQLYLGLNITNYFLGFDIALITSVCLIIIVLWLEKSCSKKVLWMFFE